MPFSRFSAGAPTRLTLPYRATERPKIIKKCRSVAFRSEYEKGRPIDIFLPSAPLSLLLQRGFWSRLPLYGGFRGTVSAAGGLTAMHIFRFTGRPRPVCLLTDNLETPMQRAIPFAAGRAQCALGGEGSGIVSLTVLRRTLCGKD